jgi:hypothetical protein
MEGTEIYTRLGGEIWQERDSLEDLDVDGSMILKMDLNGLISEYWVRILIKRTVIIKTLTWSIVFILCLFRLKMSSSVLDMTSIPHISEIPLCLLLLTKRRL